MRTFLVHLLIALSLGLCALIWFQWDREAKTHRRLQDKTTEAYNATNRIVNLESTIRRNEAEIQRLDTLKNELRAAVKSNEVVMESLTRDLRKANAEIERHLAQIETYKEALDTANANIVKQNDTIRQQNEEMKKLGEERNEVVGRFNKVVGEFNELATKWNELQEKLASTPPPPPPPSK